jgi:hypothetical protein
MNRQYSEDGDRRVPSHFIADAHHPDAPARLSNESVPMSSGTTLSNPETSSGTW